MRYHLKLEWENEEVTKQSVEIGEIETTACQSAADVGVPLSTGKALLTQLQRKRMSKYRFGRIYPA